MRHLLCKLVLAMLVLASAGVTAYGQGGGSSSSLSGLVVDQSGGVIPGADVSVKNNATSSGVQDHHGRQWYLLHPGAELPACIPRRSPFRTSR